MFNKEPQKINPNDSGIDFSKSEKIRKHFKNEKTNLYSEIIPGPVVGDELILYVDSKRLKNLIAVSYTHLTLPTN